MILTCPECATRYQTDAALFTPDGRKVRCAKCGHAWFQSPPEPEVEPVREEPTPVPAPSAEYVAPPLRSAYAPSLPSVVALPAQSAAAPRPPGRWPERLGVIFGWAALAAILLGIGWSSLHYRQDIARAWPQSSSLYSAVGMPVNTRGIEFVDNNARFETEDGQDVLVITGDFANITSRELTVPPIRVSLVDADKRELYHWNFSSGVTTLAAGKTASFRTQLPSPPPGARHIELRFAEQAN